MDQAIKLDGITQVFGGKRVLNGIHLQIQHGEILGLLGPSGAGKTTIVKILTGQLVQTEGTAWLLGVDTRKLRANEYRKIGTMMDNFGLYDRLSVLDNMKFFADIYRIPYSRIDTALCRVGLGEEKRTIVAKLSKGMRSRLSLARAVLNNAEVLFLDEPTSGLDPATTREIHKMLLEEREKGTTIFLTTHNMTEAESICDHVALLNQGELVEYGAPKDVCKKYNHLNRLQIQLKDGSKRSLENNESSADEVYRLLHENQIVTIHSSEPDLETVFIELTGRGLE